MKYVSYFLTTRAYKYRILAQRKIEAKYVETMGDNQNPAVLFFHAMGVTGNSSERVSEVFANEIVI